MSVSSTLIAIGGPTSSGKTGLAIRLAKYFGAEVISADSRQFYTGMQIGTARPTVSELQGVPHHFLGFLSPDDDFSAGQFEKEGMALLNTLFAQHKVVILVGGSGLYLNALLEGIDDIPKDEAIRETLNREFNQGNFEALQMELWEKDPQYAEGADMNNPRRVLRALEVIRKSGKPFSTFRAKQPAARPFHIARYRIDWPREYLYQRIDARVNMMIAKGLVDEVSALMPYRHCNALNTVGYKEIFHHLDGYCSLEQAIKKIKQHTRNYAKRQETWFRNQGNWEPIPSEELDTFVPEL